MLQRALRIVQPLFLAAAVLGIAFYLRSHWNELSSFSWRIDWGRLAVSAVLLLLTWSLEVGIWHRLLVLVGGRIPYLAAVRIWFLSAIMRYIPGNIWQPLSMTAYCMQHGVRPEATLTSIALYQAIILLAAIPFAAAFALIQGSAAFTPALTLALLIPVAVFILKPGWLSALLNAVLVRLGRKPLDVRLRAAHMLGLMAAAVLDWILWGLTFAAFTASIANINAAEPVQTALLLVISYPIAYTAGFLSFFTPSGFGVREGAFFILLAPVLGGGVATIAALGMRVFTTLGELLMAAASAPFERLAAAPSAAAPSAPELGAALSAADVELGGRPT